MAQWADWKDGESALLPGLHLSTLKLNDLSPNAELTDISTKTQNFPFIQILVQLCLLRRKHWPWKNFIKVYCILDSMKKDTLNMDPILLLRYL